MRGIINFFLRNTVAANLLMVFILIMGALGLSQIKTTFFPETESRLIQITTIYPGASPEEMEEGVVTKVEENLIGVQGIKRTTSISSENSAQITVEVERGFDADLIIQDVKNAVDQINSFPVGMEPPIIFKVDQLSPSYTFALSGDADLRALKKYAYQIEDDLLAIDGISRIALAGFPDEEIEITFRESEMRALNITFDEAVRAVADANLLSTGGTIKTENEELLIRAKNKEYYAQELEEIVVRTNQTGGVIHLHEIATVRDRWEDSPTRTYVNGQPGIVITVSNTTEEDMFANSDATQAYLAEFMEDNPSLSVTLIQDGKDYLNERISFIKENGLI
ncbi:MAG: efflux RND transporter permease subunit, partial [Saprospiraceae bacterium]|nr:efflux RND transporter permease subunit [Saprospiraceae bacterium]